MPASDHDVDQAIGPRLWGMCPTQLHDHLWASRGVEVVRRGHAGPSLQRAQWYLLIEPQHLALIELPPDLPHARRRTRSLWVLSVQPEQQSTYREQVYADADDRLIAVRRQYRHTDDQGPTILLTSDHRIAQLWHRSKDTNAGRRGVRLLAGLHGVAAAVVHGRLHQHDTGAPHAALFTSILTHLTVSKKLSSEIREVRPGLWIHDQASVPDGLRYIPPVWIGAGVTLEGPDALIGPMILEDRTPVTEPPMQVARRVDQLLFHDRARPQDTHGGRHKRFGKRLFDVLFSIMALMLTAPLFPFIMLAIWLEDGRPFLFEHVRQTRGGRNFVCYKFRTMSKDADHLKAELKAQNVCDGPQFFVENDPRLLRVGKWLRRFHLDELPQFFNVLLGQMNIIGPRPSPEEENQFCPAWRDARLSVHPGMTGLWQVSRTRSENADFQEWIRYDMNYVQQQNWRLDVWIIYRTIRNIVSHVLPQRKNDDHVHTPEEHAIRERASDARVAIDTVPAESHGPLTGHFPPATSPDDEEAMRKAA